MTDEKPQRAVIFVRLSVETRTAMHIGAGMSDESDHTLFRRRDDGTLSVPGSGIAGALRAHLTRIAPAMTGAGKKVVCDALDPENPLDKVCGCVVCHLMGDVFPGDTARASRLIVDDAVLDFEDTHIRDGVGIDRVTGAASRAARAKFDLETVPPGVPFVIEMELEIDDENHKMDEALLALVLDEWEQGRIQLGGRSSRGLGALHIREIDTWKLDLSNSVDDLMLLLRSEELLDDSLPDRVRHKLLPPQRSFHATYQPASGNVQSWVEITFDLQSRGFFLANDASRADAIGFGHVSMDGVLPGSSLRGVLRSQAERIARTLANLDSVSGEDFLRRCPASNPLAIRRDKNEPPPDLEASVSRIRWSRKLSSEEKRPPQIVRFFDLADRLFGNTYYGSRLVVEDLILYGRGVWKPLDFLAIDRFTGGGAEGLKFDALVLWQPRFAGRLYLEAPHSWELGWLLFTLKDVIDGRVPVGFGGAKGFGQVTLDEVTLTIGRTYEEAFPVPEAPQSESDGFFRTVTFRGWDNIPYSCFKEWGRAWLERVRSFNIDPRVAYKQDTDYYWRSRGDGLPVYELYPREIDLDDLLYT